jgi:hypothetical protein
LLPENAAAMLVFRDLPQRTTTQRSANATVRRVENPGNMFALRLAYGPNGTLIFGGLTALAQTL